MTKNRIIQITLAAALLAAPCANAATFGYVGGPRYHIDMRIAAHPPCNLTSDRCIAKLLRLHVITKVR